MEGNNRYVDIEKMVPDIDINIDTIRTHFYENIDMYYSLVRNNRNNENNENHDINENSENHDIHGLTLYWNFNSRIEIYTINGVIVKLECWDG